MRTVIFSFYRTFIKRGLLAVCGMLLTLSVSAQSKNWANVRSAVLSHYAKNPMKLKAAQFLVDNIPYHFSIEGATLNKYYDEIEKINNESAYPDCRQRISDLYSQLGDPNADTIRVYDTAMLSADFLIRNIDDAFDAWQNGRWAHQLDFDGFCEYLLPYKIGNDRIEEWRKPLKEKYLHRIDWMKDQDDKRNSAYWAALYINDQIKKQGFHIWAVLPQANAENPLQILRNMRMGECNDYAMLTAYIMRSCGIPVGIDFTPQWPFRSSGHYWNTLVENSGRNIPFMGGESNPGYPCKAGYTMAKVFRRTFGYNSVSLYAQNDSIGERVPANLNTPFIKDVTAEYVKGRNVTVNLGTQRRRKNKFVYLSVFNNQKWIPVAFGKLDSLGKTVFYDVGGGIVYLPSYWGANGSVGAADPIEVKSDGTINALTPDTKHTQTISLSRKFPVFGGVLGYSNRMVNGYFEAANTPDFKDAVRCAVVTHSPMMHYDSVMTDSVKGAFRYWRYVSPKNGYCNVAEIQFLKDGQSLAYTSIVSDNTPADNYKVSYAFDHDELTFYESKAATGGWIGVDMGKKVKVDEIRYIPRNDDNNVVPGHNYELCYYDNGKEKSMGTVTSKGYSLTFSGAPTNALFILHDHSKGTEERVFTYENGNIHWY